jgi:hypothetical protein
MEMLREARAAGIAALQLPNVLVRRGCGITQYVTERDARYPVMPGPGRRDGTFECRLRQSHPAGDHVIVLGEVVALMHRPQLEPLILRAGTYKSPERERAAGYAADLVRMIPGRRDICPVTPGPKGPIV